VRHTLTALPALPQLSLLFRREPCPCMPLHSHTSSSAKIRRCCVDSLNSPPKADIGERWPTSLPYRCSVAFSVGSGTRLSSALLTNSTESIAAPSWVRNCSIASFIGGGRSPHQLIA